MRPARNRTRALLVAALVALPTLATAGPAAAFHELSMARADSYTTAVGTTLIQAAPGVLANDDNSYGGLHVHDLVSPPSNGAVGLDGDGSFDYTPSPGFYGTDTFTYRANDSIGTPSNVGTVTITVNAVPVAADDAYTTAEDTSLTADVLANDSDIYGGTLSALLVSTVQHGTLTWPGDGTFTYVPAADFNGTDSFAYTAWDGMHGDGPVTVSLTVTPVNDPPRPVDDAYTTPGGVQLSVPAPGVLANDVDVEGDGTRVNTYFNPANGTLYLGGDGAVYYTPAAGFKGTDTFTYRPRDLVGDLALVWGTVTVTVANAPPVATGDGWTTSEDDTLVVTDSVLDNDSDANPGDTLTAVLVDGPASGTLDLRADGTFTYTPSPDTHGTDSFTYAASDGEDLSAPATVTIGVDPVADAPVAVDETVVIDEDAVHEGVVVATDADGDTLTFRVMTQPVVGTATIDPSTGLLTVTPPPDFHGSVQVDVEVCDPSERCATALIDVIFAPVPDAPVAQDRSVTTDEDSSVTTTLDITDPDSTDLGLTVVTAPAHGTVTVDPATLELTYTPDPERSGPDSFEVSVCDGTALCDTATVTVDVTPVDDAPVVTAAPVSTDEDTAVEGAVVVTDPDSDTFDITVTAGPSRGTVTVRTDGTFTYVPAADENGLDRFTVQACDGDGGCSAAVVHVTVTPVNDAPTVTVPGGAALRSGVGDAVVLRADVSDAELGFLTITWLQTGGPTVATTVLGPRLTFTPTDAGSYGFTVTVCDSDGACSERLLTVEVVAADAPGVPGTAGPGTAGPGTAGPGTAGPGTAGPARGLAATGTEGAAASLAALLLLATGGALVLLARRVTRA